MISGDFNIDGSKSDTHTRHYLDVMRTYNIAPAIHVPTNMSSTIIDNIFTNFNEY